ncbi:hypothetical protein [Arthrobacter sp. SDTb3-6]|uniref:hypothetical protein n=1 Tax=Arthrobacter sp. SDTb3-6 TaxID=2713571 RepID=UPI00159EB6DF|nr:hypothetical protein [Arthrobacter sp. SDTb3-6]NVM97679.1 hypothetical protein [Arthrobacter sp. SDTb3-6]
MTTTQDLATLQAANNRLTAQVKALVDLLAHRGTLTIADAYGIHHIEADTTP